MSRKRYAITIKQPWVAAILRHGKDVENRCWETSYRGRLYIHSAASEWSEPSARAYLERVLGTRAAFRAWWDPLRIVRSAIVGHVDLIDVVRNADSPWTLDGSVQWVLRNPRVLKRPIPMRGAQRVWTF